MDPMNNKKIIEFLIRKKHNLLLFKCIPSEILIVKILVISILPTNISNIREIKCAAVISIRSL